MIETALDEEMSEHLGYDKHEVAGPQQRELPKGVRTKTVLTDNVGPIQITVPCDRDGTFSPVIVAKRQRRLGDVDTIVLSLSAKGLTTGETSAHFAEIYGASLSKDTDLADHRPSGGRDGRMDLAVAGEGLPSGVHRRDLRQDP